MYATLSWTAVTTNSDGTPITDLAGYYVYHGFVTTVYNPGIFVAAPTTQYLFTGLEVGITHYFNVKAADTSGNLSAYAGEITLRLEAPVFAADLALSPIWARARQAWSTDVGDVSSGYMAEAVGLNLPPPLPPPPEQFPIYEAIGGFMIV
jgi:hypothetical protein